SSKLPLRDLGGQCQHTDWIGLCWAILGQPVGTRGWQWAASGGNIPLSTAKSASTRSIHVSYWDRWCGTARIIEQHLWRIQKNLLHFAQPRTILVVIAESGHRSNLVGAVGFVFRKFVVTRAKPRRVLVVRAGELVPGAVVTWAAARIHVDEIIFHEAVVERAPDRAISFRCEEAFVEKFVRMAVGACDLGNTPVVERIVRSTAQHHEEPVFVTNIVLPKGFLPVECMKRPQEGFCFPAGWLIAEIGEQLPPDLDPEPVYRSVVSFSSCAILPLRSCESEIEFDLALAVFRYLGEVLPATNAHRFIQNPTIEKIMYRDLFTDSFLVELCRREGHTVVAGRVGEVASPTRGRLLFPRIVGGHSWARGKE